MNLTIQVIRRGDIFRVTLDPVKGSEQGKTRPCVVIQNNIGNDRSPVTIIACITSAKGGEKNYPFTVPIRASKATGLDVDSIVLLNQIRTVDKGRLIRKIGQIPKTKMQEVDQALMISLAL